MAIKINGVEIPAAAVRFELDRLVKFYSEHMSPEEIKAQMPLLKRKACEQAIGARLLIDEAARLKIKPDAADVAQRLALFVENAGGDKAFDKLLKKQGITRDYVRQSIEQGRRVDLLVEQITGGVEMPDEEEVRAHFDAHSREYRQPDRVQARHILITPSSQAEGDCAVAKSRLQEIRRIIEDGAEFADQAAAHSDCPSGTQAGGSLGWVSPGMMVPEFDKALFEMAVGETSDVVETSFGYHIINKTAQEAGGDCSYEDARDRVRDFLIHAARGDAIKAYVERLKATAVIEED